MPNNRIAVLYDADGTPVDAWSWDDQYSWGGPPTDAASFRTGDRLEYYQRRHTDAEIRDIAKKAQDDLVKERLEAARKLLIAAGEIPDPNAPTTPTYDAHIAF